MKKGDAKPKAKQVQDGSIKAVSSAVVKKAVSKAGRFSDIVRPSPRLLRFTVTGLELCIVNAVRRAVMADVPTAAFAFDVTDPGASMRDGGVTGVRVVANTSTLDNEFLAHRVSLVPICITEDALARFGVDSGRLKFHIKMKNKAAASGTALAVTSEHIQVTDAFGAPKPKALRDALFPPDAITGHHILLTQLRPNPTGSGDGEELHIEAVASYGSSSSMGHARWSPVSECFFRNRTDPVAADAAFDEIRRADPSASRAQFNTLEAHRCYMVDEHGDPNSFEFFIECECGLRPDFLVFKALRVLAQRVMALSTALAQPDDHPTAGVVKLEKHANAADMYEMHVKGEGHTLGNLVSGLLYVLRVRDATERKLQYIGYHQPHPLANLVVFKFKVAAGEDARAFMIDAMDACVSHLADVTREWVVSSGLDQAVRPKTVIGEIAEFMAQVHNGTIVLLDNASTKP